MSTLLAAKPFEISTHNGVITLISKRTGEHRTIRIRTQPKDSRFAPGERVAQLLSGPDNTTDYRSFAFVKNDGNVFLFSKHWDSEFYKWLRKFLMHPEQFESKVEISFEGRCRRCNRLLTDPGSIASGIGPTCEELE